MSYYREHIQIGRASAYELRVEVERLRWSDALMALAIFAGKVRCDTWEALAERLVADDDAEERWSRLLELRIFDAAGEMHAVRNDLSEELVWRVVIDDDDDVCFTRSVLDEIQLLDIDEKRSNPSEGLYQTTGGGPYMLPLKDATTISIRNYIDYDEDGMAHVVDYRILAIS